MQFEITGAYSFADTYDVMQPNDGVIARAGRLTGAWRFKEKAGQSGNVHVNAATAVRIVPNERPSLMGTAVEGRFVGGRGKYKSATGTLKVVSVNGFIENGVAEVRLSE